MKRLALFVVGLLVLTGCQKAAPPVSQQKVSAPEVPAYQTTEQHKQALALVGKADYAGAEALLKQVVADQPKAAEAWNDLSFVQAQLGHWPDSVQSARKALEVNPYFSYAEYNLGWSLLHTNDWQTAREYLATSAELQPDRPEPLYALGEWYRKSGAAAEAAEQYRKAAAMGYKPAQDQLAAAEAGQATQKDVEAAMAAFPGIPTQVIQGIFDAYVPAGTRRRLDKMVAFEPKAAQARFWAALIFEQGPKTQDYYVQLQVEGSRSGTYRGKCPLGVSAPPAGGVTVQALPFPGGQHLLITIPGKTVVCGVKDQYAANLLQSDQPVVVGANGLTVGGTLQRFVPEVSQYLPGARADLLTGLLAEIRNAGYQVEGDAAVWGDVNPGGQSGVALAWTGGVAFKPEGKPALFYPYTQGGKRMVMVSDPTRLGMLSVSGHSFLAVTTHQPGAPNGGDVLVLEYDPAGGALRSVFHGSGDGAGFDKDGVYTSVKLYRPEGGFDAFETQYKWDEATHTFVKGETTKVGK